MVEPHRAPARRGDGGQVVGDEDDSGAAPQDFLHAVEAALLEGGITDGEDLVDEQDVGL
jgi:hypothetical protein